MSTSLRDLLAQHQKQKHRTDAGTLMHAKLQRVIIDDELERGDDCLITQIKSVDNLTSFFKKSARTEVPVCTHDKGQVISRRIDRLIIDKDQKIIFFLDYKTDLNKAVFRDKYIYQMKEYATILRAIYPDYSISGFILWLHDWGLEKIV